MRALAEGREGPATALLPDGRVLFAGGWGSTEPFGPKLASAELYDPGTRSWTSTLSMSTPRHGIRAIVLPNGTVLVAGGYNNDRVLSAELYDPVTGSWITTGSLPEPFLGYSAALLAEGTVLISGGDVPFGPGAVASDHAALYEAATGTWTLTDTMIQPRLGQAGVLLHDGRALMIGGAAFGGA